MTRLNNNKRNSNIELLRICMMWVIIAHHYIVNSGILEVINTTTPPPPPVNIKFLSFNSLFACVYGWGGKMAINVFILITGYFMCNKEFNWKKILTLCIEIMFYRISIHIIFLITGYEQFSFINLYKVLFCIPFGVGKGFTASFLVLYILIPYINKLVINLTKKDLIKVLAVLLTVFTGFSSFLFNSAYEYIGWYITVYLIGAYLKLYPITVLDNIRFTLIGSVILLILSWISVLGIFLLQIPFHRCLPYYFFVNDSNKILAIVPAVFLFSCFKNIHIPYNKVINTIAASTFGILLIHASSDTMRQWLWHDIFHNAEMLTNNLFLLHAIIVPLIVFFACFFIDFIRKQLFSTFIFRTNY